MSRLRPPTGTRTEYTVGLIRFVAVLGVISSVTLATFLFLSAAVRAVRLVLAELDELGTEHSLHTVVRAGVEQADTLLIATALLIVGFGLYGLFVDVNETLPPWLRIATIDDLKSRLLGVVVVALAVRFFALVYEFQGDDDLLEIGVAIGAVVAALAAYTFARTNEHAAHRREQHPPERSGPDQ